MSPGELTLSFLVVHLTPLAPKVLLPLLLQDSEIPYSFSPKAGKAWSLWFVSSQP